MSEFLGNNNPFYFEKDIKLLNGDILSLRNAITADAETVVNFFKVTSDESDNLSFSSDEYFVTPYEEKIVISNINRNSKTIMILGFIDEVLCCIAELNSSSELRLSHNVEYSITVLKDSWGMGIGNAITKDRLEAVRESDAILREEFANAGLDKTVWQYFTAVPDFKSVGVRDNARSFEYPVIIRAVNTVDAMTATIEHIDWAVLDKITNRILKEVKNVNRVCYDLSPKPSATIEWE